MRDRLPIDMEDFDLPYDEFKRLDKNKDNKISQEEFKVLVKDLAMFSIENM